MSGDLSTTWPVYALVRTMRIVDSLGIEKGYIFGQGEASVKDGRVILTDQAIAVMTALREHVKWAKFPLVTVHIPQEAAIMPQLNRTFHTAPDGAVLFFMCATPAVMASLRLHLIADVGAVVRN